MNVNRTVAARARLATTKLTSTRAMTGRPLPKPNTRVRATCIVRPAHRATRQGSW
jgi:hypothetical protein